MIALEELIRLGKIKVFIIHLKSINFNLSRAYLAIQHGSLYICFVLFLCFDILVYHWCGYVIT